MASTIRGSDNFDSAGVGKNASAGAVGSYAALRASTSANRNEGATLAGSSLFFCNFFAYGGIGYNTNSPSGTWRCMGSTGYYNGSSMNNADQQSTLWLRIS